MLGCRLYIKKRTTSDWLGTLLHSKFFGSCSNHRDLRKNEKNVFCIDCNLGFCRHCMKAHCRHRWLQICKYVYHDVVRLQDMQKHLDCSKIQTYKINGEKAVHLNPRPQSKETKPSSKAKTGAACEACGRYIQDPPNRFCSIACKVSVVSLKPKDQKTNKVVVSIRGLPEVPSSPKENYNQEISTDEKESSLSSTDFSEDQTPKGWLCSALKPSKRLRKRKGVPRRAPFC